MALAFVTDNDWFALATLLMQDCFSNDRRHYYRRCINTKQKRPDVHLCRIASCNPAISEHYHTKSEPCNKRVHTKSIAVDKKSEVQINSIFFEDKSSVT